MNTVAALLRAEDILLDIEAASREQLFEAVGRHMEGEHAVAKKWVATSLLRREKVGSTGLGAGFAIPHARVKDLDRIRIAYARLKAPIPFDAPDGQPVSDLLFLLVPKEAAETHLQILADATRMFSAKPFREQLQRCGNPQEVRQLFAAWALPAR